MQKTTVKIEDLKVVALTTTAQKNLKGGTRTDRNGFIIDDDLTGL
jgi:hypothetical protein